MRNTLRPRAWGKELSGRRNHLRDFTICNDWIPIDLRCLDRSFAFSIALTIGPIIVITTVDLSIVSFRAVRHSNRAVPI